MCIFPASSINVLLVKECPLTFHQQGDVDKMAEFKDLDELFL